MARVSLADLPRNVADRHSSSPSRAAQPCLVCGRWILDPRTAVMMEYTTTGDIVTGEGDAVPDSQGWFPVGRDCARMVRRALAQAVSRQPPRQAEEAQG